MSGFFGPRRPGAKFDARIVLAALTLAIVASCSAPGTPATQGPQPRGDENLVSRVLAYQQAIQPLSASELARERRPTSEERTPERQMQQALLSLHHRNLNLQRARTLLETVLSSPEANARRLHGLARLLLDQVTERQRLDGLNERLAQQLERTGSQLEHSARQLGESQALADELQRKLDALAEIERSLPARPAAGTPPGPEQIPSR